MASKEPEFDQRDSTRFAGLRTLWFSSRLITLPFDIRHSGS